MKGICVQSGASVGITYSKVGYKHTDEIIRDADAAMYYAKNAGRSRFEFFHPLLNVGSNPHEFEANHHLDTLPMHFRSSEIITLDEENQLWQSGALGSQSDNPRQPFRTIVYVLNFALRFDEKHFLLSCP